MSVSDTASRQRGKDIEAVKESNPVWISVKGYPRGVAHLTTKGVQILKYLIKKKGALVSREELMKKIWKTSYYGDMNTLYTNIAYLRAAIEADPSALRYLLTKRGKGCMLNGS